MLPLRRPALAARGLSRLARCSVPSLPERGLLRVDHHACHSDEHHMTGLPVRVGIAVSAALGFLSTFLLALVFTVGPIAVAALILYWIIRLAVRHGIRDSRR